MRAKALAAALFAALIAASGLGPRAAAEIQLPRAAKTNADYKTLEEFEAFYDQIEEALQKKDIDKMMSFYAEDYLYHGITKKQLKFMWLEIFSGFTDLYSVHVFTKIDVHGGDAILICTGALFGIPEEGADYQTVDRWVTFPHWITKVEGQWKMIGGGTHKAPGGAGSNFDLHPLF